MRHREVCRLFNITVMMATLAVILPAWLTAQAAARPSSVRISGAALASDVALLRRAFETLHPGVYRHVDKRQVDTLFSALAADLSYDRTVGEAFVRLSEFTAQLQCGHTYPNYWNQSKALRMDLMEGGDKLPFTYRVIEGVMMVDRSATEHSGPGSLRHGDEILSISGAPAAKVLKTLMQLVRADGENDAKRRSLAELRGLKEYEAADVFVPLLFPPSRDLRGVPHYQLQVRRAGIVRNISVSATRAAERNMTALPAVTALPRSTPWSWSVEGTVGVIRSDKFIGKNSKGEYPWSEFLANAFAEARAKRLRGVVVDLRENEGGIEEDAALLLRYLSPRPIPLLRVEQLTSYESVPADLQPHLDTWDRAFFDRTGRVTPIGDGTFRRADGAGSADTLQPAPNAFTGNVVLLVGPVASSASHWMTQVAQEAGIARIVGEPTGGSLRGGTGGELFFLRLPSSGIEVDLPLIASRVLGSHPPTGVLPDVPVQPTRNDFLTGRDPARMRAVAEAARQR